ncbi:caspase domain-containing protein [Xylaria cf. heliscus]|nr:caspase domain-containing protein [Xylaria cf. heliscus]
MYYALLVGINFYPGESGEWRHLKGAVNDVREINHHLIKSFAQAEVKILTATLLGSGCSHPIEGSDRLATYTNVISSLERITAQASPGDFVYIHFSGHGTAIEPSGPFSDRSTGDLALVLLQETEANGITIRYLRGVELSFWINNMVERDLKVTLVLDCCASGSVMRKDTDSSIRYLPYDDEVDKEYPPFERAFSLSDASRLNYRGASLRPNWLVNPNGYTILTACGPNEVAKELVDANGQSYGALSYFLVRAFIRCGRVEGRQQHFYSHLCARFRESWPRQKPMFYGNKALSFFGDTSDAINQAAIPIVKINGNIRLEAGQAHAVCNGDRFALHPFASLEQDTELGGSPVMLEVTKLGALASNLKVLGHTLIQSGAMAVALTHLCLRSLPIRLELRIPGQELWAQALAKRPSLNVFDTDHGGGVTSYSFYVAIVAVDDYEIRDESNRKVLGLPKTPYDLRENADYVLDVVEHLARFKILKNLTNELITSPSHPFIESFSVQLVNKSNKVFYPGCLQLGRLHPFCSHEECVIEVEEGDKLQLIVQNRLGEGCVALHLHIYDMGSLWEIENLLQANHNVVLPLRSNRDKEFPEGTSGLWRKRIQMSIPREIIERGLNHCEDIFKVFLTTRPTSFMSIELPEIGKVIEPRKIRRGGEDASPRPPSDDWAVLSFRVRTYSRQ